ncbi:MAG: hypothetical protein AAFZ49_00035 [Cyanobacteria bacterium J06659_2]
MPKFSRQVVDAFQEKLSEIDEAWQSELNLRETVLQSFEAIKRARRYKASWQQIADILMSVSESDEKISPESIRQYYFKLVNHPKAAGKRRAKVSESKGKVKPRSSDKFVSKIEATKDEAAGVSDVDILVNDLDTIESEFNLSRLKH